MTSLLRSLTGPRGVRSDAPLSVDDYFSFFGHSFPVVNQTLTGDEEKIPGNFEGYVRNAYQANGVIFACMLARLLLFSEARFQYQRLRNGRPGDLFGDKSLTLLEEPWKGGTTGKLLMRALQDADLAGNHYSISRDGLKIRRARPDWITIVLGSETGDELDSEVIGYSYQPGGPRSGQDPITLLPDEVAHFAPIPDPLAKFRGMSWLTPVLREIQSDGAATSHKQKFFENGATPNMVVKLDPEIQRQEYDRWVEKFEERNVGLANAYRTLYLGGGADANVVGANFQQLEFKATQGAGETRIAAAAGVPPVIVGLSEGLQAATYSNYGQARRRFADGTMRPLWREVAGAFSTLVKVPPAARLWYDASDISFLQEDQKDAAEIQSTQSTSMKTLVEAGFTPDSVTAAVIAGDFSKLEHTGLFSVQLQPANPKNTDGHDDGGEAVTSAAGD